MHNMMVEERLEHGNKFSGDYLNDDNDYETDRDGNVLDEVKEFVHMMDAEMSHSQHIDLTTQFLQSHIDFWTHTQIVIQE